MIGHMAKQQEQRLKIIEFIGREQVGGDKVKRMVLGAGWNAWQVSILISKMVKDGHLVEVGLYRGSSGNTYRKTYGVTDAGRAWSVTHQHVLIEQEEERPDMTEELAKADATPGKWVLLPVGVNARDRVLLRDQGYEVRQVVRMPVGD